MHPKRYCVLLLLSLLVAGCGGDNLMFDFPESTPPPDPGPPPPKPTDGLATSPPEPRTISLGMVCVSCLVCGCGVRATCRYVVIA